MADKTVTLKINLKPGDVSALKSMFKSVSAPLSGGKGGGGGGGGGGGLGISAGLATAGAVGAVVAGLKAAFDTVMSVMGKVADKITDTFKTIAGLVEKANPGSIKRLTIAWDDMQAVMGHSLEPIIEMTTKSIRLLGDFLAAILPSGEELRYALAPLNDVFKSMAVLLGDIAPEFKAIMVGLIRGFGEILAYFTRGLMQILALAKQFGLISGRGKLPTSERAAARPNIIGSPEDYAKSIYTAIAGGQGKSPQEQTAENTGLIWETLKTIGDKIIEVVNELSELWDYIVGIFKTFTEDFSRNFTKMVDTLIDLPKKIVDALNNLVPGAGNAAGHVAGQAAGALGAGAQAGFNWLTGRG